MLLFRCHKYLCYLLLSYIYRCSYVIAIYSCFCLNRWIQVCFSCFLFLVTLFLTVVIISRNESDILMFFILLLHIHDCSQVMFEKLDSGLFLMFRVHVNRDDFSVCLWIMPLVQLLLLTLGHVGWSKTRCRLGIVVSVVLKLEGSRNGLLHGCEL